MNAPSALLPRAGALRYMRWRRLPQLRVLGVLAHISAVFRRAAKGQRGAAAVGAIGGGGHGGQVVSPIRKRESKRKSSVGPKFDGAITDLHFRIRFGGAIDDQFGIHIEPE